MVLAFLASAMVLKAPLRKGLVDLWHISSLSQEHADEVVQKPGGLEGSPCRAVDSDAELLDELVGRRVLVADPGAER
jgi:hypothetical protein